jgi:hypothetical protein
MTKNDAKRPSVLDRRILCRIYGAICEKRQWWKRYNRELEDLYSETNVVNVIKSGRLRWAGHVARMDENELPKKICTNSGGQRGRGRPKSRWIDGIEEDAKKLGSRNWLMAAQHRSLFEEAKTHQRLYSR